MPERVRNAHTSYRSSFNISLMQKHPILCSIDPCSLDPIYSIIIIIIIIIVHEVKGFPQHWSDRMAAFYSPIGTMRGNASSRHHPQLATLHPSRALSTVSPSISRLLLHSLPRPKDDMAPTSCELGHLVALGHTSRHVSPMSILPYPSPLQSAP